MTDYDEPIEELHDVPGITLIRLHRANVTTIRQAKARIAEPRGLGIPPHQLDELRNAIHDWETGR